MPDMSIGTLASRDLAAPPRAQVRAVGSQNRVLGRFAKHRLALAGVGLLSGLALIAVLAPLLSPYDAIALDLASAYAGPSPAHLFGTDQLGRDVFTRVLYGARISLTVGPTATVLGLVAGVAIGLAAAYYGGVVDGLLMRAIDVLMAFPFILLAIVIVAWLGPSLNNAVLAVGIVSIPTFARLARGTARSIIPQEYILSCRAVGASASRTMFLHVLPNMVSTIIVQATLNVGQTILAAASLSFLGLGAQPPTPEWGAMTSEGRDAIFVAAHASTFPGLAILLTVLSVNLIGDGLRDALDPRSRA
jgi:peptide/nickel transport system permease protein